MCVCVNRWTWTIIFCAHPNWAAPFQYISHQIQSFQTSSETWCIPGFSQWQEEKGCPCVLSCNGPGLRCGSPSPVLSTHEERSVRFLGLLYCQDSHHPQGCLIQTKSAFLKHNQGLASMQDPIEMEVIPYEGYTYLSAFRLLPFRSIVRMASCTQVVDCWLQGLLRAKKTLAEKTLK